MRNTYMLLLIVLSFSLCVKASYPRQILLTWQNDPQTTMTISWRGDEPLEGSLRYRLDSEAEWEVRPATPFNFSRTSAWIYRVELTQLLPGQEYTVVLAIGDVESDPFTFRTLSDQPEEIVFAAGSDSQVDGTYQSTNSIRREINAMVALDEPHFVLYAGDLIEDPLSEKQWDDWFDDWHDLMITPSGRRIPVVPAIGNHEGAFHLGQSKSSAPFYFGRFALPGEGSYYDLSFGPHLSVIVLDSGHSTPVAGRQTAWLEETLRRSQSTPWILTMYHVQAYPSAWPYTLPTSVEIRRHWVPLFESYGVRLSVEGHDHTYKRTEPIRDGQVDHERGIVYIGDGGWGTYLRNPRSASAEWYLAETASEHHYYLLTLSADGETLRVEPRFASDFYLPQVRVIDDGYEVIWQRQVVARAPAEIFERPTSRDVRQFVTRLARVEVECITTRIQEDLPQLTPESQAALAQLYQLSLAFQQPGKPPTQWLVDAIRAAEIRPRGTPFTLTRREEKMN